MYLKLISAKTNLKNGNIKYFKLKFKTQKKETSWTFKVPKRALNKTFLNNYFILYNKNFDMGIKTKENLPKEFLNHDCDIHFDGLDYYIIVPIEIIKNKKKWKNHIISVDPNVVDIHTNYDPINEISYEIGKGFSNKIFKFLKKIDKLITNKSKETKKNKKTIELIIKKIRRRIQNIQMDTHNKIANFYCDNYDNVIIPQFKSKEMTKKQNRKISSIIVRKMNTISHGKLLKKLKTKAEEKNTKIIIQEEAYTTQMCGKCNYFQKDIECKRICSGCSFNHYRDINASRNILFKNNIKARFSRNRYISLLLQDV